MAKTHNIIIRKSRVTHMGAMVVLFSMDTSISHEKQTSKPKCDLIKPLILNHISRMLKRYGRIRWNITLCYENDSCAAALVNYISQ